MTNTAVQQPKNEQATERRTIRPVGNITEEAGVVTLRLEMPGVGKDDLDVNINGDALTITGRRDGYAEDVRYVVHERRDADFRASYTLDERVDRDKVDAKMENGILTLNLHLKEEVKPRKIDVKVE